MIGRTDFQKVVDNLSLSVITYYLHQKVDLLVLPSG